ncbi:MAG: universal stress protein [Acidimicrobiia bacterium]
MTLYVSWGGSGTTDSLRNAARNAKESGTSLVYLGVVDDESFGDVDGATMEMLVEELNFLLRTQLVGVTRQIGAAELPTSVEIRRGDVAAAIADVASHINASAALIGGPLPIDADTDPDATIASLAHKCGLDLRLI